MLGQNLRQLTRIAATLELLLESLSEPGAEHLADDALLADLQDLRDRVFTELGSASGGS